jgi:hypothetical protein
MVDMIKKEKSRSKTDILVTGNCREVAVKHDARLLSVT